MCVFVVILLVYEYTNKVEEYINDEKEHLIHNPMKQIFCDVAFIAYIQASRAYIYIFKRTFSCTLLKMRKHVLMTITKSVLISFVCFFGKKL